MTHDASASVLSERLRDWKARHEWPPEAIDELCTEAADEIDRLARELAEANRERDGFLRSCLNKEQLYQDCRTRMYAAEAELAEEREEAETFLRAANQLTQYAKADLARVKDRITTAVAAIEKLQPAVGTLIGQKLEDIVNNLLKDK